MSNEYIKKKDAILRAIDDVNSYYLIQMLPAEDVAPIRHAHWIKGEYWSEGTGMGEVYGYYYKCSDCGETVQGGYKKCTDKYCRNCGAKMDEKLPKGGSF